MTLTRSVTYLLATLVLATSAKAQDRAAGESENASARRHNVALRVAISLESRTLWVIIGVDTVRAAPVAVASDEVFSYEGRRWHFTTPRGRRVVLAKRSDPIWSPPDWHYAEVAREHDLRLRTLTAEGWQLSDGRRLVIRDSVVGLVDVEDESFEALPVDEHIVFDSTLFIPPLGTRNRQLVGALGRYALDLGNGYLLHGTPDPASIGTATTHGCIRLGDEDIAWLYRHVPIGASVYVF